MKMVHRRTANQLCRNYPELVRLARRREPVIVVDGEGKDDIVLISAEEYDDFAYKSYLREKLDEAETYAEAHPDSWLEENEWKAQVMQIRDSYV